MDADGMVLGILVQERRKQAAAETFPRRLVEAYPDAPRVGVTGRRASYAPAIKQVLPQAEHRQHTGPNDRAEHAHRPTRRERTLRRFKSVGQAQRSLERFGPIRGPFSPGRHRRSGRDHLAVLGTRLAIWRDVTGVAA